MQYEKMKRGGCGDGTLYGGGGGDGDGDGGGGGGGSGHWYSPCSI